MSFLLCISMVAIVIVSIALGHALGKADSWSMFEWVVILCLALGFSAATIYSANTQTSDAYAASYRQDVKITTTWWWNHPVATSPCRVKLDTNGNGNETKLVLPSTGKLVTPELLEAVCK